MTLAVVCLWNLHMLFRQFDHVFSLWKRKGFSFGIN